ncbi:MAG: uracil-DNA glycosylase [Elusimicrobia bacterium]|nr:uracil-DNA glycosylase [Elusimicrobiota bacterium]
MTAREDLKDLTRALRRRVALSDDSDWTAAPSPVPAASRPAAEVLAELAAGIAACRRCPLGAARIQAVPGVGSPQARVMFVGEGPGFDEDHQGEPFVGRSGKLLDKIMESIGLSRAAVYIANIVKCHPMTDPTDPEKRGNDRPPSPEEIAACRGWLDAQIRALRPRVIVTLGAVAARVLLQDATPITRIRGRWRSYDPGEGAPPVLLLPTFHPAALLRNPDLKRDVWSDMKSLREELSKP